MTPRSSTPIGLEDRPAVVTPTGYIYRYGCLSLMQEDRLGSVGSRAGRPRTLASGAIRMREIEKIGLERAILHQVEPGSSGLRMSGRELALDGTPSLAEFLAGHIRNGLHDSQTRMAVWSEPNSGGVPSACQPLLDGTLDLVTASQRLARALHAAIGNDQRIARGALVVAVCYDAGANDATAERFVALVKLDPSGVFRPEWRTAADGTSYLSVSELPDALPTLRERLQKCAFVRTFRAEDRYNLLVLDRQVADVSARFFLEDFLDAKVALKDEELTVGLYRAVHIARNRLEGTLTVGRLLRLDDAIQGVFGGTAVDLNEWLSTLPEAERNAIDKEVRHQQLDRAFTFDSATLDGLSRKVRFRGDHGLELRVNRDALGDTVRVIEGRGPKRRRVRVEIDTDTWKKLN
jgi:hypothetical protein